MCASKSDFLLVCVLSLLGDKMENVCMVCVAACEGEPWVLGCLCMKLNLCDSVPGCVWVCACVGVT